MYKLVDVASVIAVFGLNEEQMKKREKVGTYIHSFAALVYDRMYNHYLLKDPLYYSVLSSSDVPRLIRMQSEYFSSLFIHPFDERILDRTRQIGQIHIALGLESIHISRGFNILSEIIIDLSEVNTQIREDMSIILKMLHISEAVMNESYFERYSEHQEELKKENEILNLFDKLYAALTVHKQSQKKVLKYFEADKSSGETGIHFSSEAECQFTALMDTLIQKQALLEGFGINFGDVRALHHRYHEAIDRLIAPDMKKEEMESVVREIDESSALLYTVIDKPLEEISATSYLGVHSGMMFLEACTQTIYDATIHRDTEEGIETLQDKLSGQLYHILGWCIEDLFVSIKDFPAGVEYDIRSRITLKNKRINIGVTIKPISNKVFMVEIIKILLEIIRQNAYSREREYALIQLVDQVERASQSKDMFLANMSHELRTPLNAIIGFSQILGMNQALPQNFKPYIDKIGIAGNNLLTLVNTILDFAKLEAGKLNFKPEVTIVSGIMRDVATIIEPMALKKSIRFHYPEMISLGLYLDRQLIHQVLLNLLSNAIKFTPEGGEVTMSVDFDDEKRVYRFSICDTGIGIEAKDIATLFDPFTQVESPFQKSSKGTGLGLAITKRIIEDLHGGHLWVDSKPGIGSCFYFTIPVSQTQNTVERYVSSNEKAKRMLIVEDALEYQKILIDRLSEYYHLVVTNSVNKAKELLEGESFDFIVLDFFLVDGISSEVLQFMENNRILTPVIIISAEDDSKLIAHLPDTESVEGIFNKAHMQEICDYLTQRL
ncbi:ATP-binding protein [Sulfuricurvum sp.]|uniref:ATP-binding protein n=1 Tax=Sulfuricurvum sp. TaxID=2025608 RepID=UPI00263390D8|nr:ATP-binding protein [Sulfuricurvum sp.]MDD2267813.1 ATP-binding protein [Sulfuricurvum sp.]MDD2783503.1 ATP-binding protein [Sulfuricurvum sp.]